MMSLALSLKVYRPCLFRFVIATTAAAPMNMAAAPPHPPGDAGLLGVGVTVDSVRVMAAVGAKVVREVGITVAVGDGMRVGSADAVGGTCTG